jgi:hypothetical protein
MNKKTARYRGLAFDPRFVFRSSVIGLALSLASLCLAATLAPNSIVPSPNPVVTAVPVTSHAVNQPSRHTAALAPAQYSECLQLLGGTDHVSPVLVDTVSSLLNHPSEASPIVPQTQPSLMVVSYHEQAGETRDIVVQIFFDPIAGGQNVLNDAGYVHARLGDELSGSADQLLGLMFRQVAYFGQKDEVERQQRAFQAMLNGDMTLLREQTIDPLHILVVMPQGGTFLPTSLRSRVRGMVVDAELAFGTWSGRIGMVTADDEAAEQVGNIVAAWREMAMSFADTFASHSSGKQLRESLKSSTVQVVANRVLASASVDSRTIVRTSKEITGHGGGCPPGGACSRDKVAICHKVDSRHEQTLCVAPAAVAGFLAHGDHCGPCAGNDGGDQGNGHGNGH